MSSTLLIFLLISGMILLFAEVFVPGGILGFIGTVLLLFSTVMCFTLYGVRIGFYYFFAIFCFICILIVFVVSFAHRLPFRKFSLISLHEDCKFELDDLDSLVGKEGVALSMLRPIGRIIVDGKRYDAQTEGIYIDKNTHVTVIRVQGNYLIIRPKEA